MNDTGYKCERKEILKCENLFSPLNVVIIWLFPQVVGSVEECIMSFWSVLLSALYAVYLKFMYGLGFEVGYSAVMDGHYIVGRY
jgi:hypothetical protein